MSDHYHEQREKDLENKTTEFGFNFGSLSVSRTCSDSKGATVIQVKTPKASFSIRATKTGQIRFYSETGSECELVAKDYIEQLEIKSQNLKRFKIKSY